MMDYHDLDISVDMVAASLEDVAVHCGMAVVFGLVEHFGGCRIYVPRVWREGHELNVMGEEKARMLMERLGGGEFSIPKHALTARGLQVLVRRLSFEGFSQRTIARRLGVSMRLVRDLKNKRRGVTKSRQGSKESYLPKAANEDKPFKRDPLQMDLEDWLRSA